MAAVVAKPAGTATKMKKPPPPLVQTNLNGGRTTAPSASPSSAPKPLPGQSATPTTATSNGATTVNGTARPNRRLQRLTTRNNASEGVSADKKSSKKFPEPYGLSCHAPAAWCSILTMFDL
jgi:hypothetical protein